MRKLRQQILKFYNLISEKFKKDLTKGLICVILCKVFCFTAMQNVLFNGERVKYEQRFKFFGIA